MQTSDGYKEWVRFYAKKNWYLIALLLFIALIGVGLELIAPVPLQLLIDSVLNGKALPHYLGFISLPRAQLVILVVVVYLVIYIIQTVFYFIQAIVQTKANQHIDKAIMGETFDASARIPYNDSVRSDPNDDLYPITGQSQIMSSYILTNITSVVQAIMTLIGAVIILYSISLPIVAIVIIALPFLGMSIKHFGKIIEDRASKTETSHSLIYSFISESLVKLRTIQAFAYGGKRVARLNELVTTRNKNAISQLVSTQTYSMITQLIVIIATAGALYFGSVSVIAGTMTIGVLVIVLSYMDTAFSQISVLIETLGTISSERAALKQAYQVIDRGRYFLNKGIKTPILGKIEFRKVSIVKGDRQIFTDLNFTIPVGSTIGIIGSSGGGKTTFVDSILRFISPNIGQIFIDDKEIREYDVDYLRQNIALVEQEPDLFDDTVNENIALADPTREFDLLDIMAASSAADLTSFMEQRKVTKDTMIDNDKLSGGQKQRIAVARAFYKRAPIVIMDEPTSALDSIAAQKVIHEVVSMGKNRTTIIITHDLDLLKQIPYVFVVGDGAIRSIQEYGGLDTYYASHSNLL